MKRLLGLDQNCQRRGSTALIFLKLASGESEYADVSAASRLIGYNVIYYTANWSPPELTAAQRLWLGREISRVGKAAFLRAFKNRLENAGPCTKPFSLADVLEDARPGEQPREASVALWTIAILLYVACLVLVTIFPFALIAVAICLPVALGKFWWTGRKLDRWAQTLIVPCLPARKGAGRLPFPSFDKRQHRGTTVEHVSERHFEED